MRIPGIVFAIANYATEHLEIFIVILVSGIL
jgi:hypothetical protein